MGVLVNGKWQRDDSGFALDPSKKAGTFSTPVEEIPLERGHRYVLYVCDGCPWAARPWMCAVATGLARDVVRIVRVFPGNSDDSWFFKPVSEDERFMVEQYGDQVTWDEEEPLGGFTHLHQVYSMGDPKVTARVSVPLLVDSKTRKVLFSESSEMIGVFLGHFAPLHDAAHFPLANSFYPAPLREEIDRTVSEIARDVGSKVYGVHMAKTQRVFETKSAEFFEALDRLEERLQKNSRGGGGGGWMLPGENPTVLDLVLFATTVRFEVAYNQRFRMTTATIRGGRFPTLWSHLCRVYRLPGIKSAVHFKGILAMYYFSVPLRVKAGITVAPLPSDFERQLALGWHQLALGGNNSEEGLSTKGLDLGLLAAAFMGGLAVGVALSRTRKK